MAQDVALIEIDDKDLQRFLKTLKTKSKNVSDLARKYATLLSAIIFQDVTDHFNKEQGPDGKWESWSDSYKEKLKKAGRSGNKILQYSGKMRQQFKPSDFRNQSNGILWYNNAKTKSGYPYAWAHDNGDTGAWDLPQREFMWASDKAQDKIAEQTLAFILDEKL